MIISIASGKGGTGKTTIATNLALALDQQVQLLDCDVEEPNTHIFIKPNRINKTDCTVAVPSIDYSKCNFCGKCADICAFNAISVSMNQGLIFPELCHSCGACEYFCPNHAIHEIQKNIGSIEYGEKDHVQLIKGQLNVGEVIAVPLIKKIKEKIDLSRTVIIDAPPGTSCPMIHTVRGSDFCILVTEPTPFGLNDLILAVEVLRKLDISFGVIVNRCSLGDDKVDQYCQVESIPILMRIPFSEKIAKAYSKGIPFTDCFPEYKQQFRQLLKDMIQI